MHRDKKTKMPEPLPANATIAQAKTWIRRMVRYVGPGFHPDTPFDGYVTSDDKPLFTPEQCAQNENSLSAAWTIFDRSGVDIYAIGLSVQRRLFMQGTRD